jgi:hypothetical protein
MPTDYAKRAHADYEARTAAALAEAIAGTHPWVVVDMDAPMRTSEPLPGGRMRLSPDVWRSIMTRSVESFELLPIAFEPLPSETFEIRVSWDAHHYRGRRV